MILCNGTRAQAEEVRVEVKTFLATQLRLTLSMEKTKITHLNEGFDFLGFTLRRSMGQHGMGTKVLITERGAKKHFDIIKAATAPDTHEDSVVLRIKALNRIISGWCRYYQYTSKAGTQFRRLEYETFWRMAHWLGRKFKRSMPQVLQRFYAASSLGEGEVRLVRHTTFPPQRYKERFRNPNPYTTQERLERENLLEENPWPGYESRPGWADIRRQALERDNWTCLMCKKTVTSETAEVDHVRPYACNKASGCQAS